MVGNQFFSLVDLGKYPRKWPTTKFFIYFIMILIFVCAMHYTSLIYTEKYQTNDAITSMIDNFRDMGEVVLFFGTTVFLLVTFFLTTSFQEGIFINLGLIAEIFESRLGQRLNYRRFRDRFLCRLIIFTVTFITILSTSFFFEYRASSKIINFTTRGMVSFSIVTYMLVLFTFYADLIDHNLKFLMKILGGISSGKSDQKSVTVINVSKSDYQIFDQLAAMKSIHLLIIETSNLVNKSMGMQILVFVIAAVIKITFGGYAAFLAIANKNIDGFVAIDISSSIFFMLILFIVICYAQKPTQSVSTLHLYILR